MHESWTLPPTSQVLGTKAKDSRSWSLEYVNAYLETSQQSNSEYSRR